jgi:RimJ/RimL family protein N-acetyltransferase
VSKAPPYRIETTRLVVRCWEPRDAALLKEAVDTSLDHLRPWMPWANDDPQTLDEKIELLRSFRSRFDADEDYVYGIFSRDEQQALGGSGLHARVGEDAFEIGYWLRASAVGHGFAIETAAALTQVAFTLCGVDRMEIRVDVANEHSCEVPRRLGYLEEARLRQRLPPRYPGAPRPDVIIFSLLADEYPASPAAAAMLSAYDSAGRRLE